MSSDQPCDPEVFTWLKSIGMEQYAPGFAENLVTFNTLPDLTDADLKECGIIALGHRKQVLAAIREMSNPLSSTEAHQNTPRKLGHFELLEPIGKGGYGTVYRAWDSSLNRQVALKLLDRELAADDPQFLKDFIREAQSAAGINHPHIVQIFFAGEEQGEFYIAMELLEGQNMADRITRGPMDERMVLSLAKQVVQALAATNARRLIHGDIKPHNIFITKFGEAKLLDFGLARKTKAVTTDTGSIVGSAAYVSPERVRSETEDFRSDIYSLGATLFEALTALPPFDAETGGDLAVKRLNEDAPSLRSVKPTASAELNHLISRMLEREVDRRPPSYDALLADIAAAENTLLAQFDPKKAALTRSVTSLQSAQTAARGVQLTARMPLPPGSFAPVPPPQIRKPGLWKRLSGSKFFLISIAVHLLIGLVATVLVVQTITAKRKLTFKGGPPSPNPSKRSVEHRVQMAKKQQTMSAPVQSRRIISTGLAKVSLPDMPAMPSLTGMTAPGRMAGMGGTGAGLGAVGGLGGGSGLGGGPVPFFGLRSGGGLAGTFYDLKQTRDGKPSDMAAKPGEQEGWAGKDEPTNKAYDKVLTSLIRDGMREGSLGNYYKGSQPLYTTQIYIPTIPANNGPKAFKLEDKVQPKRWIVVYRGKVTPPETGRYRFVGFADDVLLVRFDNRLVLDGSLLSPTQGTSKKGPSGAPTSEYIEVRGGIPYNLEIAIGERPGGEFNAFLLLEKEGAQYEGAPRLPIFKLVRSEMPKPGKGVPTVAPDTSWSVWKSQSQQQPPGLPFK